VEQRGALKNKQKFLYGQGLRSFFIHPFNSSNVFCIYFLVEQRGALKNK